MVHRVIDCRKWRDEKDKSESVTFEKIALPGRGPKKWLPENVEEKLRNFIKEARYIGIPRSRLRCAKDLQEYITKERLEVKFPNNKPGTKKSAK